MTHDDSKDEGLLFAANPATKRRSKSKGPTVGGFSLGLIARYLFALYLLGVSLRGLFVAEGPFVLVAIVGLVAGFIALPEVSGLIGKRLPAFANPFAAPLLAIVSISLTVVIVVIATGETGQPGKPAATVAAAPPKAPAKPLDPEIAAMLAAERGKTSQTRFTELVERELMDRVADFDVSEPRTMADIWLRLGELDSLAGRVREGRRLNLSPEQIVILERFEKALSARQKVLFPVLRNAFRRLMDEGLWDRDIDVIGSGRTIEFVGSVFIRNAEKQMAFEAIESRLKELRFSKARYRWIPNGEGAEFSVASFDDGDVNY